MSGPRKLLLSGLALTGLLGLVAIASRARRPGGGTGGGNSDSVHVILQYVAAVGFIVLPIGALLLVWGLAFSRKERLLAGKTNWRRTLGSTVILFAALLVASLAIDRIRERRGAGQPVVSVPSSPVTGTRTDPNRAREMQTDWLPLIIVSSLAFAIAATTAGAVVYRRRHGPRLDEEARLAQALDEVLADTLDDLRAERDPRKAVIAAYARMEATFAAYRVERHPAETPLEYVGRVLDTLSVSGFAVRRLLKLFERAKFSAHEVDPTMKDDAIEALTGIRAELEADHVKAAA